jgi:hypothetical protein
MDAATLARIAAASRAAIGVALLVAPRPLAKAWLGDAADHPGTSVAVSGLGVRDLALGAGTLWSLGGRKRKPRPWLVGSGAADAADLLGTVRARAALSTASVIGTVALAGGSAALHAWLQSELG